jgi:hypothetical protein
LAPAALVACPAKQVQGLSMLKLKTPQRQLTAISQVRSLLYT